ncbi:MAG: hypothetical protein GX053_01940 [Tissierella sp.]|nr:hypothetical protein [Tissierella sp.]
MDLKLKVKSIALANGDEYVNCKISKTLDEFYKAIEDREFINILINDGKQEVLINSDYVVSLEI